MSWILLLLAACAAPAVSAVTVKLGMDTDYPPYAFKNSDGGLEGFGKDIADAMTASAAGACADLTIEVVYAPWDDCWVSTGGGALGQGFGNATNNALFDGCLTYTHTLGVRDQLADFSGAILGLSKGAGLMTLLDNGVPKVTGLDNLKGKKIVDVGGWAPTKDTLAFVENKCTGEKYDSGYEVYVADGNDAAMAELLAGRADAMFVYADQAHTYTTGCADTSVSNDWNCSLWEGFGTTYAYVQTGQFGYQINGTTLAMSKKGSGVPQKLNPCLWEFLETKEYFDICTKHNFLESCYRNSHFTTTPAEITPPNQPTTTHTGTCKSGYCPCPAGSSTVNSAAGLPGLPRALAALAALAAALLAM